MRLLIRRLLADGAATLVEEERQECEVMLLSRTLQPTGLGQEILGRLSGQCSSRSSAKSVLMFKASRC